MRVARFGSGRTVGMARAPPAAESLQRLGGALVMLNKVKQDIADCHRHAAECREKAEQTSDADMKRDLMALERSWLFLASSYELSERLSDFSDETERHNKD